MSSAVRDASPMSDHCPPEISVLRRRTCDSNVTRKCWRWEEESRNLSTSVRAVRNSLRERCCEIIFRQARYSICGGSESGIEVKSRLIRVRENLGFCCQRENCA